MKHFLTSTVWNNCRIIELCQQTLTVSIKMFRFQLKLNMLPMPLTLSASVLHLSLTPPVIFFSDVQKMWQKYPPNLKIKIAKKKSGVYFHLTCSVFVCLKMEAYRLFSLFPCLCTVPITLSSWLHCFNLGGILWNILTWATSHVGGITRLRRWFCLIHSVHLGRHRCLQHMLRSDILLFCEISSTNLKHQRGETLFN